MTLAPSAPPMLPALPTGGLSGSISTLNLFGSYITALGLLSLMLPSVLSSQYPSFQAPRVQPFGWI